jgi:predicted N-acetyltransferase YhbS
MQLQPYSLKDHTDLIDLYTQVFSDSEGAEEGESIGELVSNMLSTTPDSELFGFVALDDDLLVAAVLFSRMQLSNQTDAYILSPMAVATNQQRKGLGQQLICYGIDQLKSYGVKTLFTYGDPNYYSKVGFQQITEEQVKAPQPLSFPHGWLAQSLTDQSFDLMALDSKCVSALNDPMYW